MIMNFNFKTKRPPKLPPLGGKDIVLYLLAALVSGGLLVLALVCLFFRDRLMPQIDPQALCMSMESNWLPILAAMCLPGALCCIALERMEHRYPIFGNPGYTYGGEDWDPVYPAMLRDENAPEEVRKAVRGERGNLALWVLGLALSVLLGVISMTGGTRLYPDGSIKTFVGFGEVTAEYAPEQIERVFLEVEMPSSTRHSTDTWELVLTLRTEDSKLIEFTVHDFVTGEGESEIDRLRQLLEQYPPEKLQTENGGFLSRLYPIYEYDSEDRSYLETLFGLS